MRAFRMLICDIRYQIKYGFYFLYGVISLLYLSILLFLPDNFTMPVTALIILTDPAALGFFFIGGMILLERGEGLHSYYSILPTTNREYILSKVVSLSLISTLVALLIAGIMFRSEVNYILLSLGVFVGASVFTLFGLAVGTLAKSINHYFVIGVPVGVILMAPAFLIYFDMYNYLIEILPATLLLRLLYASLGLEVPYSPIISLVGLTFWLIPAFALSNRLFAKYIQRVGG